jgi:two-component system chemotaxis sensor kinase CheA
VRTVGGRESILTGTGPVVLRRFASVLGVGPEGNRETGDPLACAVLMLNGRRIAFVADRLVDEREATIKETGLQGAAAGLTAGAVPMDDGTVAVVLNVPALFERASQVRPAPALLPAVQEKRSRKSRILVVDDSLTTRSLEKSILEANGYEVKLAVDGLEAYEQLRIELPDLVISDVSMPRMTGFQLVEQMKKNDKMKNIPFILVTSLDSPEEQQLGLSLGADAYITKRKFDQRELLNVIREMI